MTSSRGVQPLAKPGQKFGRTFLGNAIGEANGAAGALERKKISTARLDGKRATSAAVLDALPKFRDVAGGEGTFGLQRAFHYAGAKNVIATLWKVPDAATAALMNLFYQNLWGKDLASMEALRQAQLELYRNPAKIPDLAKGFRGKFEEVPGASAIEIKPASSGKAHPLQWAAFTLSGAGR